MEAKRIQAPIALWHKAAHLVCTAGALGLWIYVLLKYPSLPEQIYNHYNSDGTVRDYMGKSFVWFMPAMLTFVYLLCRVTEGHPAWWNVPSPEKVNSLNRDWIYENIRSTAVWTELCICLYMGYIEYHIVEQIRLSLFSMAVFLAALIGGIVFFSRRASKGEKKRKDRNL